MKPTMTTADIAQLAGVTRRHATGQIVKRPGFPAPCINASQPGRPAYSEEHHDHHHN